MARYNPHTDPNLRISRETWDEIFKRYDAKILGKPGNPPLYFSPASGRESSEPKEVLTKHERMLQNVANIVAMKI